MRSLLMVLTLAVGLLSGCATVRLIDSDVVSVVAAPAGMSLQGAKYRFERLPSQANNPEAGLAEQQAQAAMTAVGLVRDDANAQLSVVPLPAESTQEANTVVTVLQKGYLIAERVLRPALVTVAAPK